MNLMQKMMKLQELDIALVRAAGLSRPDLRGMTSLFLREVDRAVDTATDEIQKMLDEIEDEKSLPACSDSSCPKFCRGRCACDARKTTPVF